MEKHSNLWLPVSKNMLLSLSPLVRLVDFSLDWLHIRAGQVLLNFESLIKPKYLISVFKTKVLFRQGDKSDDIYIILHGRLRAQSRKPNGEFEL